MYYEWSQEKNERLKKERGISFEAVILKLINEDILDIISNPSKNHPDQKVYVVEINNYIYYVPHVQDSEKVFLKTIIPSRKATKKYKNKIINLIKNYENI